MKSIQNIIFDLGGVLLNIDFERSRKAFEQLGIGNFRDMISPTHANELFHTLETGIDIPFFYDQFRAQTGTTLSNEVIEEAWSALLIDFRTQSVEKLKQLKNRYNVYLLSNTNEIHVQRIHQMFRTQFNGQEFEDHFHAAYYSQRIGVRKPDAKAWLHVLNAHALNPSETLFIDDGAANIEAARNLGMQTVHLLPSMRVEHLEL